VPADGSPGVEPLRIARVVPDVTGVDRQFDYAIPAGLVGSLTVGSLVRVTLRGRRVRGWVVETRSATSTTVPLRDVLDVVSLGPSAEVVELARFAAWRYAGRMRPLLVAASAARIVRTLPPAGRGIVPSRRTAGVAGTSEAHVASRATGATGDAALVEVAERALRARRAVLRLPPCASRLDAVVALLDAAAVEADRSGRATTSSSRGADGAPPTERLGQAGHTASALVLVPERRDAEILTRRLRRVGYDVALHPDDWAAAAAGGRVVVGTRAGTFATVEHLVLVLVLDAHAESYVEQRSPTWAAPVVVAERARRAGRSCVLITPCPTVEHLAWGELVELPRAVERAGWPPVEILDRRGEDPRSGLFSPRLAPVLAAAVAGFPELPAVCVLNRTGRVRLLACGSCGELARCLSCGAALVQRQRPVDGEESRLDCPRCGASRPAACEACGSTRLKLLRAGVGLAAEQLAALTGKVVAEVSGREGADVAASGGVPDAQVLVGTEAVLHRLRAASVVVFLDIDHELLAPRYRAGEQTLALVARAARLVGGVGRSPTGLRPRVVVQTRLPDHEVLLAAARADPGILASAEAVRRRERGLPPARALASVSGPGAAELADALTGLAEVAQLDAGRYLARAASSEALANAFAATGLVGSRTRIAVDPVDA
jgi:primosomal protein N' (replication factor Y)